MHDILSFEFDKQNVRSVLVNNEPYFVAKDISTVLGYSETNSMTRRLDDEDFISTKLAGMNMKSILINESGLYSAIIGSRLPSAKKFKHWVTQEVLPSIRRHGAYMTSDTIQKTLSDPDYLIQLATQMKVERDQRIAAENKIQELQPKAEFADAVSSSKTSILVGDLSKMIQQNGIDIGANRLFKWLRTNGYLISSNRSDRNMPTQRSMKQKLFEIQESTFVDSNGDSHTARTTKVTSKGQQYFINKFLKEV